MKWNLTVSHHLYSGIFQLRSIDSRSRGWKATNGSDITDSLRLSQQRICHIERVKSVEVEEEEEEGVRRVSGVYLPCPSSFDCPFGQGRAHSRSIDRSTDTQLGTLENRTEQNPLQKSPDSGFWTLASMCDVLGLGRRSGI